MSTSDKRLVIDDLRGGRNGFDPPWALQNNQCVDAVNVDFYGTRFAHKRLGMTAASTTGVTCTGVISSLFRHVPGILQSAAELWMVDDSATPIVNRLAGGTSFAAPTLLDAPTGNGYDFTGASINGKFFCAYKSGTARHHCWDGSTVRRTGLAATGAPTAANGAVGGTYAATLRYYRQRSTVQDGGGITIRRSEPSASVSFTPDGAHTTAVVTKATAIGEGETHWEVEGSTDNSTFYRLSTVVIATATYADSAVTTSYNTNPLSAETGVYTLQKPYRFIAADQNRHLGLGSWTATDKQSRLEISAVIGSLDISDEERIDTSAINYYIDFEESDTGVPTGLKGPIFGAFFVFKDRQVWQLTPTGQTSKPYEQKKIAPHIGALHHHAIDVGEDAGGSPAIYFMSHRGPYRWSIAGLEYLGHTLEDYTLTGTTINLAATKSVARVVYFPDKRQVWYWWATGSSNDCNQGFIYDVVGGGWTRIPTGDKLANVRCAVMFANTLGASMSLDLKPYVGQTGGNARLWKCDTGVSDNGTSFQGYILTKAYEFAPGFYGKAMDGVLLAQAASGVTITDTITADFGFATASATVSLTATGSETRVSRMVADSGLAGNMQFHQHTIGDAAASTAAWTLDRYVIPYTAQQAVSR